MAPPLYVVAQHTVGRYLSHTWQPATTGPGHLPTTGGAILVANYLSIGDQLFLGVVTHGTSRSGQSRARIGPAARLGFERVTGRGRSGDVTGT